MVKFFNIISKDFKILLILFIIFLTSSLLHLNKRKKVIFPKPPSSFQIKTYTDDEDPLSKGNSQIVSFSTDSNSIFLAVIIGDAIDYPYAGFRIQPPDSAPFYNIKGYDRLDIKIDSTNATFFIIDLTTYIEGYSHFDDYMSFRHHTKELFVEAKPQILKIPMKTILTQGWWYNLRKINPKSLDKPDFTRCHTISFEINAVKPKEKVLYMKVSRIEFIDTQKEWLIISIISLFLIILYISYIVYSNKKQKTKTRPAEINIKSKEIELTSQSEEELQRICDYIAENFTNPDLTINDVAKGAGVSTKKITSLLNKYYGMQYKQYLNHVRIKEAKRLLENTDRNISEISFAVGYSYVTTFNRIFKDLTNTSPKEFRKQHTEKPSE